MQQKVAEYVANLLMAGVGREKVAEMGYHYALSLQTEELPTNDHSYAVSRFMFKASEIVRDAMPEADKIHHERCMVKPIAPTAQIHVDLEAVERALGIRESEDKA